MEIVPWELNRQQRLASGQFSLAGILRKVSGLLGPDVLYRSKKPKSQDFAVGPQGPVDQQETGPRYTRNRKA